VLNFVLARQSSSQLDIPLFGGKEVDAESDIDLYGSCTFYICIRVDKAGHGSKLLPDDAFKLSCNQHK
jgi:hypothetical protein